MTWYYIAAIVVYVVGFATAMDMVVETEDPRDWEEWFVAGFLGFILGIVWPFVAAIGLVILPGRLVRAYVRRMRR